MATDSRFQPGFDVHFVQARKALESLASSRGAMIKSIGDELVVLEVEGSTDSYHCSSAPRLSALVSSGRCALSNGVKTFGLLTEHGVLVVPASDETTTISPTPSIDPTIVVLDDGAATHSPTDGGAWHLFSVALQSRSSE